MLRPAAYLGGAWATQRLGLDPLAGLLRLSGWWALAFLLAALSVGALRGLLAGFARWRPLRHGRRLADWNGLVRARRPLGLSACAYAALHCALYFMLELDADPAALWLELQEKRYLQWGAAAMLVLLPLAATSNRWAQQRLGRLWPRLHAAAYLAAGLALAHDTLQAKPGHEGPWWATGLFTLLLLLRLRGWFNGQNQPTQTVQREGLAHRRH